MHRFSALFLLLMIGFAKPVHAVEAIANHALFRRRADVSRLELYWHINPASLHYRKDSAGRLSTRIRTQVQITGDTGIVFKDVYYLETKPFNPETEDPQNILELAQADVPAGRIKVELTLSEDAHPESSYYYSDTISVAAAAGVAYSSLQLLDTFFIANGGGVFEKANYYQLPRVLPFYDEGQFRLHAYAELYGTESLSPNSFPLSQLMFISRTRGERDIAEHLFRDTIKAPTALHRFRHSFSLDDLSSGNYYLNATLRTADGVTLITNSTFFQTINKHPVVKAGPARDTAATVEQVQGTYLDLTKTFVSKFDMSQLRAILKMLQPTAAPSEVAAINGFLERPDELYMRYFIFNHFSNVNKADPAKAWKQFSDIVREVNRLYKSGSKPGYETDRGIIHLRYGAPVEVIHVSNEAGAVPYEIWRYNVGGKIGGSGLFLFYSPGFMSSDFQLLHSTVPGERNNPGWRSALYSTGRSSGNTNARAEEYFGK